MKDSEIVDLYLKRDELAISETKNKYGTYCYTIAWNILSIKEDAEECVSDTYYKAWTSIPPTIPNNLKAWLSKVVRNISINLWNKNHAQKNYRGMDVLLSELEECVPSCENVEKQIEAKELGEMISEWLRSVSETDRSIFMQRYFEGFSVKQIAGYQKTEAKKISKRLFCLRAQLKEILEKKGVML